MFEDAVFDAHVISVNDAELIDRLEKLGSAWSRLGLTMPIVVPGQTILWPRWTAVRWRNRRREGEMSTSGQASTSSSVMSRPRELWPRWYPKARFWCSRRSCAPLWPARGNRVDSGSGDRTGGRIPSCHRRPSPAHDRGSLCSRTRRRRVLVAASSRWTSPHAQCVGGEGPRTDPPRPRPHRRDWHPEVTNVMVLRVGALLTYSVSIDERVQELEEVWVFADSGRTFRLNCANGYAPVLSSLAWGRGLSLPMVPPSPGRTIFSVPPPGVESTSWLARRRLACVDSSRWWMTTTGGCCHRSMNACSEPRAIV